MDLAELSQRSKRSPWASAWPRSRRRTGAGVSAVALGVSVTLLASCNRDGIDGSKQCSLDASKVLENATHSVFPASSFMEVSPGRYESIPLYYFDRRRLVRDRVVTSLNPSCCALRKSHSGLLARRYRISLTYVRGYLDRSGRLLLTGTSAHGELNGCGSIISDKFHSVGDGPDAVRTSEEARQIISQYVAPRVVLRP